MKKKLRKFHVVGYYEDDDSLQHTFADESWGIAYNHDEYIAEYTDSVYEEIRYLGQKFKGDDDDYSDYGYYKVETDKDKAL